MRTRTQEVERNKSTSKEPVFGKYHHHMRHLYDNYRSAWDHVTNSIYPSMNRMWASQQFQQQHLPQQNLSGSGDPPTLNDSFLMAGGGNSGGSGGSGGKSYIGWPQEVGQGSDILADNKIPVLQLMNGLTNGKYYTALYLMMNIH